jgi:acetolactate synthase-1/2/3 large subunit
MTRRSRPWWKLIAKWRARNSLGLQAADDDVIMPQYAIQRLYEN